MKKFTLYIFILFAEICITIPSLHAQEKLTYSGTLVNGFPNSTVFGTLNFDNTTVSNRIFKNTAPTYTNNWPNAKKKVIVTLNTGALAKYSTDNTWTAKLNFTLFYYKNTTGNTPDGTETATIQISNTTPEVVYVGEFNGDNLSRINILKSSFTTANLPANLLKDIQLTLAFANEFIYVPATTELSTKQVIPLTDVVVSNTNVSKVRFTWSWGTNVRYPEYDLEIIKLDPDETGAINLDWKNAARIEGKTDLSSSQISHDLTLAEGTGYYFWRVRPIYSTYPGGRENSLNYGNFNTVSVASNLFYSVTKEGNKITSVTPLQGNLINSNTGTANAPLTSSFFHFYQFDENKNFSYGRVFSEEGKMSEKLTYANGLGQVQQVQTYINTLGKVISTQTVYDYLGRPTLQTLPAPTSHSQLGYQNDFFNPSGLASGTTYTAAHFDENNLLFSPYKADSTKGVGKYYSMGNTIADITDPNNYVPTSDGYPFIRTQYYKNPLGRVFRQSQPGETKRLKSNSDSKNIVTRYASVSQNELDRIFGNEAPNDSTVFKTLTTDANGISTASYTAYSGEILASCMVTPTTASDPNNVLSLGNEQTLGDILTLPKGNYVTGDTVISTSKTISSVEQMNYGIIYSLTPANFQLPAAGNGNCANICKTCDYHIEFNFVDQENPLQQGSNYKIAFDADYTIFTPPVNGCSTQTVNLGDNKFKNVKLTIPSADGLSYVTTNVANENTITSVSLPPGSYILEKKIKLNQNSYKEAETDLITLANSWTNDDNCCGETDNDAEIAFGDCDAGAAFCNTDGIINTSATEWDEFLTNFAQSIFEEHTKTISIDIFVPQNNIYTYYYLYNPNTLKYEESNIQGSGSIQKSYSANLQNNLLGSYYWDKAIATLTTDKSESAIKSAIKTELNTLLQNLNKTSDPTATERVICSDLNTCYATIMSRFNSNLENMLKPGAKPQQLFNNDGSTKTKTSITNSEGESQSPTYDANFDILKYFLDCIGYERGLDATYYSNYRAYSKEIESDPDAKLVTQRRDILMDYRAFYTSSTQDNNFFEAPGGNNNTYMAASLVGIIDVPSGVDYLYFKANDGVKVWIDGQRKIFETIEFGIPNPESSVIGCSSYTGPCFDGYFYLFEDYRGYKVPITSGKHQIKIQYFSHVNTIKMQMFWHKTGQTNLEIVPYDNLYPNSTICNQYNKVILYSNRNNTTDYITSLGASKDPQALYIHFADDDASETEKQDLTLAIPKPCVYSYLNIDQEAFDATIDGYGIYTTAITNTSADDTKFNPALSSSLADAISNVCGCSQNLTAGTENPSQTKTPANETSALTDKACTDNCEGKRVAFGNNLDMMVEEENSRRKEIYDSDPAHLSNPDNYPSSSTYQSKSYYELFDQEKCCVVDALVEQCINMCSAPFIKSIDKTRLSLETTNPVTATSYSITYKGTNYTFTSYKAFTESSIFYELLQQDQNNLKLALTGHISLKEAKKNGDVYTSGGDLKTIQAIIIDKIYEGLTRGMVDRKPTSVSDPNLYETVSEYEFLINNTTGTNHHKGKVKTSVKWAPKNGTTRSKDQFVSARISILDKSNTELDYAQITQLRPFYFGAAGFNVVGQVADIYFDSRGSLHILPKVAVASAGFTQGNGNAIVTNGHIASINITATAAGAAGKDLKAAVTTSFGTQYILDSYTLPSSQTSQQLCSLLVNGVNTSNGKIKFEAIVDPNNSSKAIIYATENTADIAVDALKITIKGDLVSNFTVGSWQKPLSLSELLVSSTETYSGNCPWGYTPLTGNGSYNGTYPNYAACNNDALNTEPDKYALLAGNKIGNTFVLTTDILDNSSQRGVIRYNDRINLANPLQLKYKVNFGKKNVGGADGLTFFFQNADAIYFGPGGGLFAAFSPNYTAPDKKGFYVEFDTYVNGVEGSWNYATNHFDYTNYGQGINDNYNFYDYPAGVTLANTIAMKQDDAAYTYARDKLCQTDPVTGTETCLYGRDIDYDHLSVWYNNIGNFVSGTGFTSQKPSIPIIPDALATYGAKNMEDGADHLVEIKWGGNTGTDANRFQLWVDGISRLDFVVDLKNLTGNNEAVFGWTAGSYLSNTQTVTPLPATASTPNPCTVCTQWQNMNQQLIKQEEYYFPEVPLIEYTCEEKKQAYTEYRVQAMLNKCKQKMLTKLKETYLTTCLSSFADNFKLMYGQNYHQYTLYFYDRAGNLRKTVPPSGVHKFVSTTDINKVSDYRKGVSGSTLTLPYHTNITTYKYNSLKQLTEVTTPDGGTKKMWYNKIGQPVLSQDARQQAAGLYTYSRYDALGRVVEISELNNFVPTFTDTYNQNINLLLEARTDEVDLLNYYDRNEQILTTYSTADIDMPATLPVQQNLRNRISFLTRSSNNTNAIKTYYSYDQHGNVAWLAQVLPGLEPKIMYYSYDLMSNKVTMLRYQPGRTDQLYQRYSYDPDNRLTKVETSQDSVLWIKDATYKYYDHGPLARTELGHDKLQGIDYVYTIEGYLKSLNHVDNNPSSEPGRDGINTLTGFCPDIFSMELGYYSTTKGTDYRRTTTTIGNGGVRNFSLANISSGQYQPLYNGNIATWATNTRGSSTLVTTAGSSENLLRSFRYDKLNRIKESYGAIHSPSSDNWGIADNRFRESFTYYPDGNLRTLKRHNGAATLIDDFTYNYQAPSTTDYTSKGLTSPYPFGLQLNNSKLRNVTDAVSASTTTGDIDNQATDNYLYDPSGNLKEDASKIQQYTWTMDGKLASLYIKPPVDREVVRYSYDATGNRVIKDQYPATTFYIRDAQGNIISIYEKTIPSAGTYLTTLVEQPIYGSSRVGVLKPNLDVTNTNLATGGAKILQNFDDNNLAYLSWASTYGTLNTKATNPNPNAVNNSSKCLSQSRTWGGEFTCYTVGNNIDITKPIAIDVLNPATIGAQVVEIYLSVQRGTFYDGIADDPNNGGIIAKYTTTIQPNGGQWQTLTFTNPTICTTQVKSWWDATVQGPTYYTTADINYLYVYFKPPGAISNIAGTTFYLDNIRQTQALQPRTYSRVNKMREYELTDHLGNIRAVIDDYRKATLTSNSITANNVVLKSFSDYYAFGSNMRTYNQNQTRYGFNGQEKVEELGASHTTAMFWEYDGRLGRRWNIDPYAADFPGVSPYSTFFNNPNLFVDPDGDHPILIAIAKGLVWLGTALTAYSVGESMHETDKAYDAKARGDMDAYRKHMAASGQHNVSLMYDMAGFGLGKAIPAFMKFAPKIGLGTANRMLQGTWNVVKRNFNSAKAAEYQSYITGKSLNHIEKAVYEIEEYMHKGVSFDGYMDGVLVEAKSGYKAFVDKSGKFADWFKGKASLVDEAQRQLKAADGTKLKWVFDSEDALKATADLFEKEGVKGIELQYVPAAVK